MIGPLANHMPPIVTCHTGRLTDAKKPCHRVGQMRQTLFGLMEEG